MSYYEPNAPVWPNARPGGWDRPGATTFQRPHTSTPAERYAAQMKTEDAAFGSQLDGRVQRTV